MHVVPKGTARAKPRRGSSLTLGERLIMSFVLPDSLHFRAVYRACDYYRRSLDYDPRRELLIVAAVGFFGSLVMASVFSLPAGAVGARDVGAAAFIAVFGLVFVAGLRRKEREVTAGNLAHALRFWHAKEVDHAFLVLFDEPRLLSPVHLRRAEVRRLIRDVLSSTLDRTSVAEARLAPSVRRLMEALSTGENAE
jgi:hypothetical protein